MPFKFTVRADSSDEDAAVDLSSWQSGATRRVTPPSRASGFQAVNQTSEDVAMELNDEPEAEDEFALVPGPAPVTQMLPSAEAADPMVISSGEEESSDDEEEAVAPTPVQDDDDIEENGEDDAVEERSQVDDDDLEEEELVVPEPNNLRVTIPRDELEGEDVEEIEDFTAGGNVVSRVLSEQQDEDGLMTYMVEFEDLHVEEVILRHMISRLACGVTKTVF